MVEMPLLQKVYNITGVLCHIYSFGLDNKTQSSLTTITLLALSGFGWIYLNLENLKRNTQNNIVCYNFCIVVVDFVSWIYHKFWNE